MKAVQHVLCAALLVSGAAQAADFGVMETADYIHPRQFKFHAYPILARPQPTQEQATGVTLGVGYGIAPRWDVEGLFVNYDDASFFGTDIEYTWLDGAHLDASVSIGSHVAETDFGDIVGAELVNIVSWWLPHAPRLALTGALDIGYDEQERTRSAIARGMHDEWWSVYAVPGIQYRVTERVDLTAEVGLGLNSESRDYTSGGLSIYFD